MIINYTDNDLELLARIMRAEALGEGNLGMLMRNLNTFKY